MDTSNLSEAVIAGLFGAMVGSHITLVSWRAPRGETVTHGAPHCPSCGHRVAPYDEIPVLSWVLLRGRCRYCHARLSARYPIIEAVTAAVFFGLGLRFGPSLTLLAFVVAVGALIALAVTDIETRLVPKRIVWFGFAGTAAVLAAQTVVDPHRYGADAWHAAACGAAALAVFLAVHAASPRGMAFGDVRVATLAGFALGWLSPMAAFDGFLVALAAGVAYGAVQSAKTHTTKVGVPFGTFLALGVIVVSYAGGFRL